MMKPPKYSIAGLRGFLEGKLGASVVRFDMVTDCSRPENFAAETASGERLLVKCVPPEKSPQKYFLNHFVPHLEELRGVSCAVKLRHGPWKFEGCTVVALEWCSGARVMPDRLTDAEEADLVRAYTELSEAMRGVSEVLPPRDNVAVRKEALSMLSGRSCRALREFVERELPAAEMAYDRSRLRPIHGDFHHGNVHFESGRVSGIMDFEDFRYGYPADDWVRYVVCGAEHLRWFDAAGRSRLLSLFSRLLPLAPADEWREAVDGLLIRKIWRRFSKRKGPRAWLALNIRFRLGFYMKLRGMIAAYAAGKEHK